MKEGGRREGEERHKERERGMEGGRERDKGGGGCRRYKETGTYR